MEEIYIVKLKGLPPPNVSSGGSSQAAAAAVGALNTGNKHRHNSPLCSPCRLSSNDRKTAFYLTTDLTAEAVRGLSYLHIFLGFTVLCLSITNLCFNDNPWSLEPPLGITLWCALTFVILGLFGLVAAHQRQCNLSRSIVYVRIYFLLIVIAISVTLTFVILFMLDLHGPVANHLIGMNILFSIVVETIILFLTLFTCARILWPSCIGFCARDWPMQANLKRKVIVKTKVFANGIDNSDEAIQSVGPNCVISLNMPPAMPSSPIHTGRTVLSDCERADTISTGTALNASSVGPAFHSTLPFDRTPSPKLLGCQAMATMATSVTTLHTIQSTSSTVDSGHCDEHPHAHQLSSAASSASSSSSSSHCDEHRTLSHGLQSAISSQSINQHPHIVGSFPLQTFTKSLPGAGGSGAVVGLQSSSTNMNQLLYQSTILRRSYLADSDASLEQQSNKFSTTAAATRLYDSDEFDYCTTEDDDDDDDENDDDENDDDNGEDDDADAVGDCKNVCGNEKTKNDGRLTHCHEHHAQHNNDEHVRALSAAGSDRTSSDEGHGSVDSSSDDAKSESSKSVTDDSECIEDLGAMKMVSNTDCVVVVGAGGGVGGGADNQIRNNENHHHHHSHHHHHRHPTVLTLESIDEGIGSETLSTNSPASPSPPIHPLKPSFIGNYEKCSKIPAPISIPKASIQKSDSIVSAHSHSPNNNNNNNSNNKNNSNSNIKPTSIRVLSNSKETKPTVAQPVSGVDRIATTTTLLKTYGSKLSSHPYLNRLKATSAIGESAAVLDRRYSKDKTGSAITVPDIERV